MRNEKGFWKKKENVIEESKKYSTRTEFKKKSHRAYEAARMLSLLDEMEWLNYKNVYRDKVDYVYKYFFKEQNAIYIGRTINPKLRDYQHNTYQNDSVYKFSKENNSKVPKMEIIESGLTINEGVDKEIYWSDFYKKNNFTLINKVKCGSIGSMASGKWSKNKCIEESKKYKTRGEFFFW
jgi:hypothetical protein